MVWYFIGVYIINRTLHYRLEIQNFSSRVEGKFRISARPCNILYLWNIISKKGMMLTASSNAPPSGRGFLTNSPQRKGGEIGMLGIDRAINNRLKIPVTKKKDPIISLLARSSPLLLLIFTFINLNLKSVSANRVWPALLELVCVRSAF